MTRRRISVFGSTGSIGCNTLDLIARQGGQEAYDVAVLSGGRNVALLAEQARRFHADMAITADPALEEALRSHLDGSGIAVGAGPDALAEAAGEPVDWAMSAIVGAAGLRPTAAMARAARVLALANKESLVCAGDHIKGLCRDNGTMLLPVDSEHSAIFQALQGESHGGVARLLVTASGGPFRDWPMARIAEATVEEALNHPNWDMGARITIDSASMFNKALEVIEAHQLFDVSSDKIEVVVHPQSIIHSMVAFTDGAIMAQMGPPDMRGPIGYALNYPERAPLPVEALDFSALARLDFETPDQARFPALRLAYDALDLGGAAGAVLNAAKEEALDAFLDRRIGFLAMADCVARVLDSLGPVAAEIGGDAGLVPVYDIDERARAAARAVLAETSPSAAAMPVGAE